MDTGSSQSMDEISLVIGRAISSLISSGKRVEKDSLLEQLKLSETRAVDGMKTVYATAITLIAESDEFRLG